MTLTVRLSITALAIVISTGMVRAQDLENGASQYRKCKSCHDLGEGAKNKIGPILNGIVGRKAGTVEGFNYSQSLKALAEGGLTWSDDRLSKYIEEPKSVVPNGTMSFVGIKDPADRADLLAYLKKGGSK